ncbi:MAG: hypothetical protein JW863_01260 [Chitinispirillaceae bacterium]|nr:hypothetical protein [Chitinispirillaceae bacterium]
MSDKRDDRFDNLVGDDSALIMQEQRNRTAKTVAVLCFFSIPVIFTILYFLFQLGFLISSVVSIFLPAMIALESFLDAIGVSVRSGRSQYQIDRDNERMTDEFMDIMRETIRKRKEEYIEVKMKDRID